MDARSLDIGDVEGDGDLDLLTLLGEPRQVIVWENLDGYLFAQRNTGVTVLGDPRNAKFSDGNNDGRLDILLLADSFTGDLRMLAQTDPTPWVFHDVFGEDARFVSRLDVEPDGVPDYVGSGWYENGTAAYGVLNDGDGGYTTELITDQYERIGGTADLNGDGRNDLIIHDNEYTQYLILEADLTFTGPPVELDGPNNRWYIGHSCDLNGDGHDDMAYKQYREDLETYEIKVVWTEPDGDVVVTVLDSIDIATPTGSELWPGDLDGDGDEDLMITALFEDEHPVWLENPGVMGQPWETRTFTTPHPFRPLHVHSIPGHDQDAILYEMQPGDEEYQIGWLILDEGVPQWTLVDEFSDHSWFRGNLADFNLDGLPDLLLNCNNDNTNQREQLYYDSRPDSTFQVFTFDYSDPMTPLAVDDHDQDGDLDLLYLVRLDDDPWNSGRYRWIENRAVGGQLSDVTIALSPFNPPIIIPPMGNTVYFDASISNNSDDIWTGDAWTDIILPNGSEQPHQLREVTVHPGQTVQQEYLSLDVPAAAPPGSYSVRGRIGDHGGDHIDQDLFTFTKLGSTTEATGQQDSTIAGSELDMDDAFLVAANALPTVWSLEPAFPNPFNAKTSVTVTLPEAAPLRVTLYNVAGQQVATLMDATVPAGRQTVTIDGSTLASGVYLLHAEIPNHLSQTRKLVLLK